ncbi:MAG: DUF1730 domain-containing protein [Clostridia bacterium]|nr:DUF1730 domain-containing protein [Clostridia bacterium]
MIDKIRKIAEENRIGAIGIVKARVFDELSNTLNSRTPMVSENLERRINPFLIMERAKSIIVCLFPYYKNGEKTNLSLYAKGVDYHKITREKLGKIKDFLEQNGYQAEIKVDDETLPERHLAYLAGLGFLGKNGSLINDKFGSFVFIGYIVTDLELEANTPSNKTCLNCGKCITHCPGGAISENSINPYLCASYITQKKGELTDSEKKIIKKSGYVWGCDICQAVCPHNGNLPEYGIPEFSENLTDKLTDDMAASNREFKKKYQEKAFSWRGYDIIKRNLEIFKEET